MREKQTEDLLMGIFSIVLLQANVQIQLNWKNIYKAYILI
jgi:hypothetical protein